MKIKTYSLANYKIDCNNLTTDLIVKKIINFMKTTKLKIQNLKIITL